jgi:hypothetical protein
MAKNLSQNMLMVMTRNVNVNKCLLTFINIYPHFLKYQCNTLPHCQASFLTFLTNILEYFVALK